ncbi:uncharacterized protein BX664DRAFT_327984 [Halteromyces radiatus]|uniref:uncharacterized protein n=1 Tax=Halteromyces radiatus TaxID=101107 RepID=UPI00221E48BC|nr:uncharacterized protein BX664DRAFT_327984 [Halteromyces radiatus]KAI8092729.1 hypothetical protein BX664DRAFT_327984 [Halteromyces radiatus]
MDINQESCTHEVQFNNLCAFCGLNLEHAEDQTTQVDITHNRPGLTVSKKEAERLEQEDAIRLLKERKLILVVDLDQTIVHATWDPTVREWMDDETNANHEATKDIRQFELPESPLVYYLKLRPGASEFLTKLSKLYELHVYTMGTRQYADAVVNEIDKNHTLFQDRIMSRDENDRKSRYENGSSTKKSLDRLFSSDKSMVAIVDDRLDVWDYSPHLVHIKPYVFFKGTGDINSPFANKKQSLAQQLKDEENEKQPLIDGTSTKEDIEKEVSAELEEQKREQDALAKQQQQERPLAQKQRELGASHQPVLVDDDRVLYNKLEMLTQVHKNFYEAYDREIQKRGDISPTTNPFTLIPNIVDFINPFRKHVLANVHIVFSGMIKLDADPKSSHWWKTAESYGATCHLNLSSKVTHLVAAKAGTSKMMEANKLFPHIRVVNPNWLVDSINHEGAQDESLYRHASNEPPSSLGNLNGNDDVANPESTPLDLEDGAFDNNQLDLEGVDWNEADDEVNEFLSDSSEEDISDQEDEDIMNIHSKTLGKRSHDDEVNESESDEESISSSKKRKILYTTDDTNTIDKSSSLNVDQEGYSTGDEQSVDADDDHHDRDNSNKMYSNNNNNSDDDDDDSSDDDGSTELDDLADLLDEQMD